MTKRRRYSDEFKLDAIRLVKEQGYNRSEAARNLGIDPGMLGRWVLEQERKESGSGPGTPAGDLQDEVKRLREENRKLKEYVNVGSQHYADSQTKLAENEVDDAKRRLKAATEAFDTDAVIEAQEALLEAKLKLQSAKKSKTYLQKSAEVGRIGQQCASYEAYWTDRLYDLMD